MRPLPPWSSQISTARTCKGVQPTVAMVLERYANKVRLVHHDMPIDALHPQARKVHEAARCAGEQNKFWEYRNARFRKAQNP